MPPASRQSILPFSAIRNADFLSNHWLEKRLPLELEWTAVQDPATHALKKILKLWEEKKDILPQLGDEAGLEDAFIKPVLEKLGWKLKYQTFLQNREPDYALFPNTEKFNNAVNAGRKNPEFWQHTTLLADAKAWHVSLDRPINTGSKREFPPEQIEWYLDRSRLDYAILTNGRIWRLIPRQRAAHQPRFQTHLECDLAALLTRHTNNQLDFATLEDFRRFYLFFSPTAFTAPSGSEPLITRAINGSSAYRLSASEALKERVFEALRLCIEGFLNHAPNALSPTQDLPACRANAFTLLYRLLFIFFAEDRQLLPFRKNDLYTKNRALSRFRNDIATKIDRIALGQDNEFSKTATDYWSDLVGLFDLIDSGKASYGVPAYNGGLFNTDAHPFLRDKSLPDYYLARVIDALGRAQDPIHPEQSFTVDYKDLAIQDLGNIYEGLLELHPNYATQPIRPARARRASAGQRPEEKYLTPSDAIPAGFNIVEEFPTHSVYLATDKGERRTSGSYYTPDHIVNYIVENTLGPLCRDIDQKLNAEIADLEQQLASARGTERELLATDIEKRRADFDDRVLSLKVLDPAMGSGHFLIRACQFLAEEIATNPHAADPDAAKLKDDESTIVYWKRKVVENCLYGVDLNPVAVELAKLALWLETVSTTQPLSFLDHHLRHGNSLVGAFIDQLDELPGELPLLQATFQNHIAQKLPILLGSLDQIRTLPSDTVPDVKKKEKLFLQTVEEIRAPFRTIADLWISTFFIPKTVVPAPVVPTPPSAVPFPTNTPTPPSPEIAIPGVSPADYHALINALGSPKTFIPIRNQASFTAALNTIRPIAPFHWQLEFPDVFFNHKGPLSNPGFHAIIGNPPYDVLSEKENKADLSALQAYLKFQPHLAPSVRGKNNLYKLFICQTISLLAEKARLGLITPMAILGDDQAAEIRRMLLANTIFETIDAFPQKDNPKKRVFIEAKLSTAVFTVIKASKPDKARKFAVRNHTAQFIEAASPKLSLAALEIPLYDPENLSIVSCDQKDWDLAVRLMATQRLGRLGKFAVSFQGELNETTDIPKGKLSYTPGSGPEVMRGAHLCLYSLREASQGDPVFVCVNDFTAGAKGDSKSTHHRYARVGFQRKSPQNNFRRIIASMIPQGHYLLESISYFPSHHSKLPLEFLLALLNSKLAEWYFRLGSTNAMIGEYQMNNLPCPIFSEEKSPADRQLLAAAISALNANDFAKILSILEPACQTAPFPLALRDLIIAATERIIAIEQARGPIARSERSHLAAAAQPYQDLIDQLFYRLAGLTPEESAALESRLATML